MALIQTIDSSDLYEIAANMGRAKDFGRMGWNAIGEYLENLSEEMGENIELDILSICCDYTMLESFDEVYDQYDMDIEQSEWDEMDDEEKADAVRDFLNDNTQVVVCEDDMIIFQVF